MADHKMTVSLKSKNSVLTILILLLLSLSRFTFVFAEEFLSSEKEIKNLGPERPEILAGKETNPCKGSLDLSIKGEVCAHHPVQTTAFDLKFEPTRPRAFLLPQLTSLFLPGFDQWWEGKYGFGAIYTGVALGGYGLGASTGVDPYLRSVGLKLAQEAGSLSAYQSFRTAVQSRRFNGEFLFLKHDESPTDLLVAPFHFSYLSRPTTYLGIPAHLLLGVLLLKLQGIDAIGSNWKVPGTSEMIYSGVMSYNAGIGEEALFRGWMMPVARHYTNSDFASNAITSVVFGALHYQNGYIPISQTLGGFYFGWLAQKNEWQLSESIFNHAWFDVLAFSIAYASADSVTRSQATFQLSPITIPF